MAMPRTLYDAYLLCIWQEERVDESSAPACYYLIEQIFGAPALASHRCGRISHTVTEHICAAVFDNAENRGVTQL